MSPSTQSGDNNKDDEASNDDRPAKRRRVAVACRPCRDRKSKCDGSSPRCSACIQQGSECSYPPTLSKTDQLRQEFASMVEGLNGRMAGIERLLATVSSRPTQNLPVPETPASRISEAAGPALPSSDGELTINEDAFQVMTQPEYSADGLGIVPDRFRNDLAFFGPSSNIAFLRLISRAIAKGAPASSAVNRDRSQDFWSVVQNQDSHTQQTSPPGTLRAFSGTPTYNQGAMSYKIPSDQKARKLLTAFFVACGHVHPYIHEGTFLDAYEEARRSSFRSVRRSWLALFYIMLALGAMSWPYRDSTLAHINVEADVWYRIASDICLKQVFSDTRLNLEVTQCLLCLVMYLEGTHDGSKPALMLSIAIKVGYQIGLHSIEASKTLNAIEAENRSRTWCGLVLLDRTLSMVLGRPAEIHNATSRRPQVFADSRQRGVQEMDACAVDFLAPNSDLYDILHRAVNTLYGGNFGPRLPFNAELLAKVYMLEGELLQWSKKLKPELSIMSIEDLPFEDVAPEQNIHFFVRRQRTIITLRYLNARTFIHRPILEGLLEAAISGDSDIQSVYDMRQASANSIKVMASSAIHTIDLVHRLINRTVHGNKQLGIWWFTLYFTFNAALCILGSLQACQARSESPELLTSSDRSSAYLALSRSLEVVDGLDEGHTTITRCREYLQGLMSLAHHLNPHISMPQSSARHSPHSSDAFATPLGPTQPYPQDPGILRSAQFQQFTSDVGMENFLFPLDVQGLGGQFFANEQAFI